jgi:hypothetical protein
MKKIFVFFLTIIVFFLLYHFWPFGKRSFDLRRNFEVNISDNGLASSASTDSKTVADFLAQNNIKLADKDYVSPDPAAKIYPGSRITIERAIPISISVDGKNINIDATGRTIKSAIEEASITLSPVDKINPDLSSTLSQNLKIVITRINIAEETVTSDIPFDTIEKEDNTLLWRKKAVKQKGETGTREKTYKVTYTNGKETNRALLGSQITKQPVSEIDVVGTKIVVGKTQTGAATWYVNGDDMTCASLAFAHGKYLRVTNRSNGKSVIVLVNDSGPYGKGRIIDLNKKAFQKIGAIGAGVINVKVEEILN